GTGVKLVGDDLFRTPLDQAQIDFENEGGETYNHIREGKFKTPTGRDIVVNGTTPFYGYVVCDLTAKVKKWLELEKNFTPMPDGLGWFHWFGNISLYMEVISWTKLLRDAEMRNKIFFRKLNID